MAFFGNLMNNYFYGKSGKGDYRVEDMPQNRRQLFGAVLKVRWSALVGVNLLQVLFWLPAAAWTILNYITLVSGAGDPVNLLSTYLLILIPLIAITGPFTAGATYVLRNWARDEHSFVWSDFWDAVKGNWKQGLVVSVISGLMPYVLYMGYTFYGTMANTKSFVFMIPLAILFLVFIVWKLSEMIIYTLMVTYDLKTKDLIRHSAYGRQSPAGGRHQAAYGADSGNRDRAADLHSVDRGSRAAGAGSAVPALSAGVQPPDYMLVFQRAVRKVSEHENRRADQYRPASGRLGRYRIPPRGRRIKPFTPAGSSF